MNGLISDDSSAQPSKSFFSRLFG